MTCFKSRIAPICLLEGPNRTIWRSRVEVQKNRGPIAARRFSSGWVTLRTRPMSGRKLPPPKHRLPPAVVLKRNRRASVDSLFHVSCRTQRIRGPHSVKANSGKKRGDFFFPPNPRSRRRGKTPRLGMRRTPIRWPNHSPFYGKPVPRSALDSRPRIRLRRYRHLFKPLQELDRKELRKPGMVWGYSLPVSVSKTPVVWPITTRCVRFCSPTLPMARLAAD